MRVNTQKAFDAWIKGQGCRPAKSGAISTASGIVYSYSTAVAKFSAASDKVAYVNVDRYSVTTTCQVNGLLALMAQAGIKALRCTADEFRRAE